VICIVTFSSSNNLDRSPFYDIVKEGVKENKK
jgi:hypothetical protein